MSRPLRILVAPLNWGLGHAARSIPIIRLLEEKGCEVVLASDGPALTMLRDEFPHLLAHELPGIEVRYGERFFTLKLAQQMPALLGAMRKERRAVANLVERESIDGIISDNRFGSWGSGVPDVVLSHQWTVETGNWASRPVATMLHRRILKKYAHCWIPDGFGESALAGRLSQTSDPNTTHIGPLSRLSRETVPLRHADHATGSISKVLVVCSGPEPLRTRLEEAAIAQLKELSYPTLIARGLPGAAPMPSPADHIELVAHLDTHAMASAMAEADVVISRTGYTTLMDLAATGTRALLIPTPGQPEQEYLASYLAGKGWWVIQYQDELNLAHGLRQAMAGHSTPNWDSGSVVLNRATEAFLARCYSFRSATGLGARS